MTEEMDDNSRQNKLNKPQASYERPLQIFNSFEEQHDYELSEMAKLSGEEILKQMRQMINIAYGMHGYDPLKLPKKHDIKIIYPGTSHSGGNYL